jgi:hypothetical protein
MIENNCENRHSWLKSLAFYACIMLFSNLELVVLLNLI